MSEQSLEEASTTITDSNSDDELTMTQLLEESGGFSPQNFKRGDLTEGTILSFVKEGLIIDLAGKSEGIVHAEEMHSVGPIPTDKINVGDK